MGEEQQLEDRMRQIAAGCAEPFVMEFELGGERWRVTIEGWEDVRLPMDPEPDLRPLPLSNQDDADRVLVRALRRLPVEFGERRRATRKEVSDGAS